MHRTTTKSPSAVREGTALLVSGDREWLASATAFLAGATRSLSTAETAAEATDVAMRQPPDVAVVAPPLAAGAALGLVAQLALLRDYRPIGIVYVTDREREVADHVRMMRAGANDWFPRGLAAREAATRIAALMNEIRATDPARLQRGPLTLDFTARQAIVGGASVPLTPREFAVLGVLVRSAGRIMAPTQIAAALGARRGLATTRMIAESIAGLHQKLGAARGLLESSRRDGYRLRFVAPP